MLIRYARICTADQSLHLPTDALKAAGCPAYSGFNCLIGTPRRKLFFSPWHVVKRCVKSVAIRLLVAMLMMLDQQQNPLPFALVQRQ